MRTEEKEAKKKKKKKKKTRREHDRSNARYLGHLLALGRAWLVKRLLHAATVRRSLHIKRIDWRCEEKSKILII